MKYIIFGTGEYYKRYKRWFLDRDVVVLLDNDTKKQGKIMDGHLIIPPERITKYEYDAVVILSFYYSEMKNQLCGLGVPIEKIHHFYNLHDLFRKEDLKERDIKSKSILLLSHDLSLGGPALALFHAALTLKNAGYEVVYASMIDGELRNKLEDYFIPVVVDFRLQVCTMRELTWTGKYDLIFCNTINFHVFLSDRDTGIPVIWWLHDSSFFYDGIDDKKLEQINTDNMKILSVGPVPAYEMKKRKNNVEIENLMYGVSNAI